MLSLMSAMSLKRPPTAGKCGFETRLYKIIALLAIVVSLGFSSAPIHAAELPVVRLPMLPSTKKLRHYG